MCTSRIAEQQPAHQRERRAVELSAREAERHQAAGPPPDGRKNRPGAQHAGASEHRRDCHAVTTAARAGLNHTLQDHLRRLPTVGGPGHDTERWRLGALARRSIASSPVSAVLVELAICSRSEARGAGRRRRGHGGRLEPFGRGQVLHRRRRPNSKSSVWLAIASDPPLPGGNDRQHTITRRGATSSAAVGIETVGRRRP